MARPSGAPMREPSEIERWPAWWSLFGVAAVVTAVGLIGTAHIAGEAGQRPVDALAFVIVTVGGASLLLRRRWPLATLVVVTVGLVGYILRDYPGGPVFIAAPIAVYAFASSASRRTAYLAAAVTMAVLVATRFLVQRDIGVEDLLLVGWGAASVLAADVRRGQRERAAAELERRRNAEEHREAETRRRIVEDRLEIARDLHDSVAHSMATINVQSGVAAHVIDRQPDQAAAALEAIRLASRNVLDELTAMLGVLRADDEVQRHPTPDLTCLEALVDSSRQAGLDVEVRADGDLDAVSPAVSTAAFRIAQEALTNVIRHAGTGAATVRVARHDDGGLDLEVVDAGRNAAGTSDGAGMGITGIRERAEITGGRCEVGPRATGGFGVAVSWPGRP